MLQKENDGQSFNLGFSWDTSTSSYAWNIMSCEIFIIDHKFHWPQACLNREAFICSRTCLNCEAPFMTTELHNAIMKRSRYRNKFLKDKSQTRRENYTIQRNLSKKLLRKTKISYFENLNTKIITDYCNYFPQKNIHSLSTIIETFEKHPSILNIKKGNLIQYFHSERLLKKRYWKLSRI